MPIDVTQGVPDEIRALYADSANLSAAAKSYLDTALAKAFHAVGDADVATRIQAALSYLTTARDDGRSLDTDLRDAEYYLHGLYSSAAGDVPHGFFAAGAPLYNILKAVMGFIGEGKSMRADKDNPNAPPGGSMAAYEGLWDGQGVDGDAAWVVSMPVKEPLPLTDSLTIDLADLGFREGDVVRVEITGAMAWTWPTNADGADVNEVHDIWYDGFWVGDDMAIIQLGSNLTINMTNVDWHLPDNNDPNGDYAVRVSHWDWPGV